MTQIIVELLKKIINHKKTRTQYSYFILLNFYLFSLFYRTANVLLFWNFKFNFNNAFYNLHLIYYTLCICINKPFCLIIAKSPKTYMRLFILLPHILFFNFNILLLEENLFENNTTKRTQISLINIMHLLKLDAIIFLCLKTNIFITFERRLYALNRYRQRT